MKAPRDQQAHSAPTSAGGGYLGAMEKLRENVATAAGAPAQGAGDDLSMQLEKVTESRRATRKLPWEPYLEMGLGLRNYWYPAFFSNELEEGKVRGEEIGGERILFKRIDGTVYGVHPRADRAGLAACTEAVDRSNSGNDEPAAPGSESRRYQRDILRVRTA